MRFNNQLGRRNLELSLAAVGSLLVPIFGGLASVADERVGFEELTAMVIPTRKVGKYELGRTIGEGSFAKVKYAQNSETGESVAVKVLDRETILKHKMVEQVMAQLHIFMDHEVCRKSSNSRNTNVLHSPLLQ